MNARPNPAMEMMLDIASYSLDPTGFARYAFPWGEGDLVGSNGPRPWQANINSLISTHLRNPKTRFQPLWIAVASGHGIGKSAEIAMLINWAMSTCEDCKVVITAGTGTQLSTKTMPEVQKWFRRAVNSPWWDINATSIRYKTEKRQANWRADAITWSEHNTEPFAGLHNLGKRILLVFDEASAIGDKVWEVAEGAMTDENTEIIWIAFGNPTQTDGRFRECFGRFKHRWKPFQIDSRTVEGTNKQQIDQWVADYGEDSDFVRVRVKGEFPRAGSTQFISSEAVSRCRKFKAESYEHLPKVLSVDVARFGDDQTVAGTRQGRKVRFLAKLRGLDTVQVAERVIEFIETERPDATVIDGDGIGAGVVDHLNHRGYGIAQGIFEFHGGQAPRDSAKYYNRRAEVWGLMRDALMADMEIPDDPELETDLTGPQYGFSNKQQIQLERKEDMKKRGLASPDCGDMLAMTFGVQVAIPPKHEPVAQHWPPNADAWMA